MTIQELYANKSRPLVFGHRGAMAYAPMNTIAAFELAAEQGADGIELDVWLSQDDVPVICHDFEIDGTTDGEGRIGSLTVEELKEFDAGSWFDEKFAGEKIPTLGEVFETVRQNLYINVEIKAVEMDVKNVVDKTVDCIHSYDMVDRVLVSSFNPMVIRQMRKIAPEISVGYLQDEDIPSYIRWLLIGTSYAAEHPNRTQITSDWVQKAKKRGRYLNTWTVNDPDEAKRLAELGVDGIITDKPDVILEALS